MDINKNQTLFFFNIVLALVCIFLIFNQMIISLFNGETLILFCFLLLVSIILINLYYSIPFVGKLIFKSQGEENANQIINQKASLEMDTVEKQKKRVPPKPLLPKNKIKAKDKIYPNRTTIQKVQAKTENLIKSKKVKKNEKTQKEKVEYLSEEDEQLDIPVIPEMIKKKNKSPLAPLQLEPSLLKRIEPLNNSNHRIVLVNCERCGTIIPIPVPKIKVESSKLPVIPLSYIHKNLNEEDNHCITIYLDKDYDIRRQRISDVVVSK